MLIATEITASLPHEMEEMREYGRTSKRSEPKKALTDKYFRFIKNQYVSPRRLENTTKKTEPNQTN